MHDFTDKTCGGGGLVRYTMNSAFCGIGQGTDKNEGAQK